MDVADLITRVDDFIWGPPLSALLVGTGLYLTIRLGFIQVRGFWHALNVITGKFDNPDDPGEVSHFRALCAALSATIGTGNIVGVAAAILRGGPGAVFWMWVTALVGMASKFACCSLAVAHRRIDENGEARGGPMHYIELGMGKRWKWLAVMFATFTVFAGFGMGNMFQVNNVAMAVNTLVLGPDTEPNRGLMAAVGVVVAALVALVIIGGIKRIAGVASKLVPAMCILYVLGAIAILIKNVELLPECFRLIFFHAFHAPESVAGGLLGGVIREGVARGVFSNEAGLGSAAMAHGAARTKEPVREGLVGMVGPFIDTICICSLTALVILSTKAYEVETIKGRLTTVAFELGMPGAGTMVGFAIMLFAFSTIISWSYYGDRAIDYLFGKRAVIPYRWVYVGFVVLGSVLQLGTVITFCDIMNGMMAAPNLIALIALSGLLVKLSRDYFQRMRDEGTL